MYSASNSRQDFLQRGTNNNKNVSSAFRFQLEFADVVDRDKYTLLFFHRSDSSRWRDCTVFVTGSDSGQGLFGVLVLFK